MPSALLPLVPALGQSFFNQAPSASPTRSLPFHSVSQNPSLPPSDPTLLQHHRRSRRASPPPSPREAKPKSGLVAESPLRPRPSPQNSQDASLPPSVGPDFRALLRPSVRTLSLVFSQPQGRCSPDLPLSEATWHCRWACALPSWASSRTAWLSPAPLLQHPSGYRSDCAWKRLREPPPPP